MAETSKTRSIFFNGAFYPPDAPLITVLDRGLCFGDGLFELIRCFGGKFLLFKEHIIRMEKSAGFLEIPFPYDTQELLESARKLVEFNNLENGELYVELTRGEAPRYHQFPKGITPNFFMMLNPLRGMPEECWTKGVKIIEYPDVRSGYCHLKTINLLPNVLGKEMARKQGVYETFFFRGDEKGSYLTEGSSSSIFAVVKGTLVTPAKENILPGITREKVIDIAEKMGIKVEERRLYVREFKKSSEAFLTSTVSEVMPVVQIEKKKIGNGIPGPITIRLQSEYRRFIMEHLQ
jgi:D-alanine transaminase